MIKTLFKINDKFYLIFTPFVFITLFAIILFLVIDKDISTDFLNGKPREDLKILHYKINNSKKYVLAVIFCIFIGFITAIMAFLSNTIFDKLSFVSKNNKYVNLLLLSIHIINTYLLLYLNTHIILASRYTFLLAQIFGGVLFISSLYLINYNSFLKNM